MANSKDAGVVYQLKITLRSIKPPIWRRVQVKDCTLATLHDIIQASMGWAGYHLHAFDIGGVEYSAPDPNGMMVTKEERKMTLGQVVTQGYKKFSYTYDFGDCWEHVIQVEKVLDAEAGVRYPRCIAGKRARPPEDCGGPWGYGGFLEAIQNPTHPEHEEKLEWVGRAFDPEAFDLEAVNMKMR